jgi:hypothetical protein
MNQKRGEIATLLTLGFIAVSAIFTVASSIVVNNKKLSLNSRAQTAPPPTPITRYGSANCTCSQICGDYSNYYAGSQNVIGSVRQCSCKNTSPPSTCPINYNSIPTITTANPNPNNNCRSSSYMRQADCEIVCGIGNCRSCKLGSLVKYECNISNSSSIPRCSKPRTHATLITFEQEKKTK